MTRWFVLAFVAIFAVLAATGHVLSRIDRARATADRSAALAVQFDARIVSLDQHANVITAHIQGVNAELALCRRRTQNLRDVLDVLIQSGVGWPERVRLPRVGGWAEWPAIRGEGQEDAR